MTEGSEVKEVLEVPEVKKNYPKVTSKRRVRLEQVKEFYFVKKMSSQQIADEFKITKRQVWQDVKIIRAMSEEEGRKSLEEINNPQKFLTEMKLNYHMRIRKLWELFGICGDTSSLEKLFTEIAAIKVMIRDNKELTGIIDDVRKRCVMACTQLMDVSNAKEVLAEIRNQEKHYVTYLQDVGAVSKKQDKPRVGSINFISLTGKQRINLKGNTKIIEGETNEENVIDTVVGNG